ncbi:MAG: glyoxalase/bleomycin resistance/dioxygenase family protein, partial [Pseudomonadota bacterium]
ELRAGTHLVLREGQPDFKDGELYFDLMVDDLVQSHRNFVEKGLKPSAITRGNIHDDLLIDEPSGNRIRFNSTHASKFPL